MIGAMLKLLKGLYRRASINIVGMTEQLMASGEWEWTSVTDALETAGIWVFNECIYMRQDIVAVQVAFHTVYELCTWEERMSGASRFLQWWD